MDNITIGQIATIIGTVVALIGGVEFLLVRFNKIFDTKLKPINTRLNDIELSSDKNFIVRFLADIEQGNPVDEVEKERFYEIYQRYKELGGNSYVSHKVEKLQKEGKL
jgi:hypothetical protein